MTASSRKNGKLKGAVLIMVVTILFILMIMILATLAVVTSTNRRTYTKYEENQAYYTARSVLEVYIKEMLEDGEVYDNNTNVSEVVSAMSEVFNFPIDAEHAGPQSYFENAGYKGGSFDETNSETWQYVDFANYYLTNGFVHQQEIFSYLKPKYELKDKTNLINSDVTSDENWKERTGWDSNNDYYIEYTATLPDITGASLSSSDSSVGKLDTDGAVTVRIELLRMIYLDENGKILTDGNTSGKIDINKVDWSKTYYRLKVTSTSSLEDSDGGINEATVSVLLEPASKISPSGFKNAMTSMDETQNDAKVFTIGGASATQTGTYSVPNNSTFVGNYVYDVDQLYMNTQPKWYQPDGSYFVVQNGVINSQNTLQIEGSANLSKIDKASLQTRPYVYSAGMYLWGKVGTSTTTGCDTILSGMVTDETGQKSGKGKLRKELGYIGWDNMANYLTSTADPDSSAIGAVLADRIALVTSGNGAEFYGDVYCDGDMYIPGNCTFYGRVFCSGTIYVGDTTKVKFTQGAILGKSVSYWDWNTNAPVALSTDNSSDLNTLKNMGIKGEEYVNNTAAYLMDLNGETLEDGTWKVDIYDEMQGQDLRGDVTVETADSIKRDYVYTADNSSNMPAGKSIGDTISATEMFNNSIAGSYSSTKASLEVNGTIVNLKPDIAEYGTVVDNSESNKDKVYSGNIISPTKGTYNYDTGCYEFKMDISDFRNANDGTVYYIDATQDNVQIQLTGYADAGSPTFVVVGNKSVIFTIKDGDEVTVYQPRFETAQIYDMLKSNAVFDLGAEPKTENNPASPNIYFYIGSGAKLNCRNSSSAFFSAYIYGPEADFYANTNHGQQISYTYNGSAVMPQKNVSILGSMVFRSIHSQNEIGIGFIKSDGGGSTTPTGTLIEWDRQKYLNR
jgi:hypothetical protein